MSDFSIFNYSLAITCFLLFCAFLGVGNRSVSALFFLVFICSSVLGVKSGSFVFITFLFISMLVLSFFLSTGDLREKGIIFLDKVSATLEGLVARVALSFCAVITGFYLMYSDLLGTRSVFMSMTLSKSIILSLTVLAYHKLQWFRKELGKDLLQPCNGFVHAYVCNIDKALCSFAWYKDLNSQNTDCRRIIYSFLVSLALIYSVAVLFTFLNPAFFVVFFSVLGIILYSVRGNSFKNKLSFGIFVVLIILSVIFKDMYSLPYYIILYLVSSITCGVVITLFGEDDTEKKNLKCLKSSFIGFLASISFFHLVCFVGYSSSSPLLGLVIVAPIVLLNLMTILDFDLDNILGEDFVSRFNQRTFVKSKNISLLIRKKLGTKEEKTANENPDSKSDRVTSNEVQAHDSEGDLDDPGKEKTKP